MAIEVKIAGITLYCWLAEKLPILLQLCALFIIWIRTHRGTTQNILMILNGMCFLIYVLSYTLELSVYLINIQYINITIRALCLILKWSLHSSATCCKKIKLSSLMCHLKSPFWICLYHQQTVQTKEQLSIGISTSLTQAVKFLTANKMGITGKIVDYHPMFYTAVDHPKFLNNATFCFVNISIATFSSTVTPVK